jgi:hypothetical protein
MHDSERIVNSILPAFSPAVIEASKTNRIDNMDLGRCGQFAPAELVPTPAGGEDAAAKQANQDATHGEPYETPGDLH